MAGEDLFVGQEFSSHLELEGKVKEYCANKFISLYIPNSQTEIAA